MEIWGSQFSKKLLPTNKNKEKKWSTSHSLFFQKLFDCEVGPNTWHVMVSYCSGGHGGGVCVREHQPFIVLSWSKLIVIWLHTQILQLMFNVERPLPKWPQLVGWRFQCCYQWSDRPPQSQSHYNTGWNSSGLDWSHRDRSLSRLSTEEWPPLHRNPVNIQYGHCMNVESPPQSTRINFVTIEKRL